MPERGSSAGLFAAAAAFIGICWGFPVLATLGALGFLAGVSTTSWVLIVLGVLAIVIGGWTFLGRRRRGVEVPRCQPEPGPRPLAEASGQSTFAKEQ